jgi:phage terminase large subunit-like protein
MTKRIPQNLDEYARQQMQLLANASERQQRTLIKHATLERLLSIDACFENWAHRNQLPPNGDGWRTWLMLAGRGFGKTRAGAEWIYKLGLARPGARIALVGATIADARTVMVEGASGVLAVARLRKGRLLWEPGLGRLTWPNGTSAQIFSGDNADGLRGPEHDFAWCDELAKWREADATWDNLAFGLRRGPRARSLVTTTPRSMPLLERIRDHKDTVTTGGRTKDNLNLDERFIDMITATYAGTRIGRQELDGELIQDVEGALWTREMIERSRVAAFGRDEGGFDRIVVGVDPPVSVGDSACACGIVVAGSKDNQLFVLEDASVQGLSPEGWANRVAAAAARWSAGLVVAEANNGGALVESVLKAADIALKVRLVHASVGKCARAEPIALKFEAGKAFLAGSFPEMEGELGGMVAGGGDYQGPGQSPDRADAMVWAMTVLSETRSGVPRVRWV